MTGIIASLVGIGGLVLGHSAVALFKWWNLPKKLFKDVDRTKLTPQQRKQLEDIEASYNTSAGRAAHDL